MVKYIGECPGKNGPSYKAKLKQYIELNKPEMIYKLYDSTCKYIEMWQIQGDPKE